MGFPLPDAANIVAVSRLIVVVRVAIVQVHVPGIRATVLRGGPEVVARMTICYRLAFHDIPSLTSKVGKSDTIPLKNAIDYPSHLFFGAVAVMGHCFLIIRFSK
ncbi:MAG: hypothetical protein PHU86_02160 [Patescibacteria group bacterium]|nr:hypothetical protein [Patescibacteria group bacterium]